MMNEIDCLLRIDADGLSLCLGTNKALPARLEEWLRTPIGSIYGLPEWGNPLAEFKHEPTNQFVAVFIENRLVSKLRTDLPEIQLSGIRCTPASDAKDMYLISFQMQTGIVTVGLQQGG
ncbi:hypothetical protein ABF236_003563 [Yersinia ruckeri]|nr:hypothetical protein [Yersinia ruckeri]